MLREPNQGRTSLAIAPSNPDVMYALAASNADGPNGRYRQGLLAVYRSDRGGTAGSWEARVTNQDPTYLHTLILTNVSGANVQACNPQAANSFINMGWYNNVIAVDPRDPDRVWAAGVDWFRSDDGGRNWGLANWGGMNAPSSVHVDQHAITFHPSYDGSSNQTVLVGNDGGIFRSTNARGNVATGPRANCNGATAGITIAWSSLNRGYGVTQFYHGTAFPDGRRYLAGAQDNGTLYGTDDQGPDGWRLVYRRRRRVHVPSTRRTSTPGSWSISGPTWAGPRTAATPSAAPRPASIRWWLINLGPEGNYLFVTPFTLDRAREPASGSAATSCSAATTSAPHGRRPVSHAGRRSRQRDCRLAGQQRTIVSGTHKGDIVRTQIATDGSRGCSFTPRARAPAG